MSEGRYWHCHWKREGKTHRVWVAKRPKLAGEHTNWQKALDRLCEAIGNASGDCEPQLSFDPPEPIEGGDRRYAHPDWCLIQPAGWIQVHVNRPELFSEGFCERCNRPLGHRTTIPLQARTPVEGNFCCAGLINPYVPRMFSEKLVEALSDKEREAFDLLPVVPAPRTRKQCFEAVPRKLIDTVAVRGWTVNGAVCPRCKNRWFLHCTSDAEFSFQTNQIHQWIAGSDLPSPPRGVAVMGDIHSWYPLFPIRRARELVEAMEGLRSGQVGLAPSNRVVRKPRLHYLPDADYLSLCLAGKANGERCGMDLGDYAEVIVDIDADLSQARKLAAKVVAHLVDRRVIVGPSKMAEGGGHCFQPGANADRATTRAPAVSGGMSVRYGRERVFSVVCQLRCFSCDRVFEPRDDPYELTCRAWNRGDNDAPYACPHCGVARPLREWDGPFPQGFGCLAFVFRASTQLKPQFVAEIAGILNHRVRRIHFHRWRIPR